MSVVLHPALSSNEGYHVGAKKGKRSNHRRGTESPSRGSYDVVENNNNTELAEIRLDLNPNPLTFQLYDFKKITLPPCGSVFSSVTR